MNLRWVFWPLVFLALAVVLFQVKYAARSIDRELAATNSAIAQRERNIEVLEAEWSHLNHPQYLADLAANHLDYDPEARTRIVNVRDLPLRRRVTGLVDLEDQAVDSVAQPVLFPRPKPRSEIDEILADPIGALIEATGIEPVGNQ